MPADSRKPKSSFDNHDLPIPVQTCTLTNEQFGRVTKLAFDRFGLHLTDRKRRMVDNRLIKLMRVTGVPSIDVLLQTVEAGNSSQANLSFFDALSTNLTRFYRESAAYDVLDEKILQPLQQLKTGRKLRIWSAGCSSGCEPYTISMVLHDRLKELSGIDTRILATDLSVSKLKLANKALYQGEVMDGLDGSLIQRHFDTVRTSGAVAYRVKNEIQKLVTFGLLNLMEPWKMKGPFDAIFCRNVIIYFDPPTRSTLIDRFATLLRPGGILFLGSSEGLPDTQKNLQRVSPSAYRLVA